MRLSLYKVIVLVAIVAYPFRAGAQRATMPVEQHGWIGAGLGLIAGTSHGGFAAGANVVYTRDHHYFAARFTYTEDVMAYPACVGCGPRFPTIDVMREGALLYGLSAQGRWAQASLAGGISILKGRLKGLDGSEYRRESFLRPGFPVEAQVTLTPLPGLGLNLRLLGSLSAETSFLAVFTGFQFGV